MDIHFLQTAEPGYWPLLGPASQTVGEYCVRHGCSYEFFLGFVRGYHRWQAAYNRIPLLKRLLDKGYAGWVCYLDADAYIADLDFDLRKYLDDKGDFALVIAPAGPDRPWWQVNAGVFIVNLSHSVAQAIVQGWSRRFDEITDEQLLAAEDWLVGRTDQDLLHDALRSTPGAPQTVLVEPWSDRMLNYLDGRFIRHVLRVEGDPDTRAASLRRASAKVLERSPNGQSDGLGHSDDDMISGFSHALYRVLLLRDADAPGLENVVKRLRNGGSFESAMRSFLKSTEFAAKHRRFLEAYVPEAARRAAVSVPAGAAATPAADMK